jgi:FeS assembly protein IscX
MDEFDESGDNYPLYWEPTYEIVLALMTAHPDVDVNNVGMQQLLDWIVALPNFADDLAIVSEELLRTILREWYEETEEKKA